MKAIVLALLLVGTQAVRLNQFKQTNSDEIDADDVDITDGPLKDDRDVAVYQQTFLDKGENVDKINVKIE